MITGLRHLKCENTTACFPNLNVPVDATVCLLRRIQVTKVPAHQRVRNDEASIQVHRSENDDSFDGLAQEVVSARVVRVPVRDELFAIVPLRQRTHCTSNLFAIPVGGAGLLDQRVSNAGADHRDDGSTFRCKQRRRG